MSVWGDSQLELANLAVQNKLDHNLVLKEILKKF